MATSTMLERVARAIAEELQVDDWRILLPAARAAVRAMLEPSDEMLEAAVAGLPDYGYLPEEWRATYVLNE